MDGVGLPLKWLGNCTSPPPPAAAAALSRPLRPRQCLLLVSPGFIRFGPLDSPVVENRRTLADLAFVIPSAPAARAGLEAPDDNFNTPAALVTALGELRLLRTDFVGDRKPARAVKALSFLYVQESSFSYFKAPLGAAFELRGARAIFVNSTFTGNTATKSPCDTASGAGAAISIHCDLASSWSSYGAVWLQGVKFDGDTAANAAAVGTASVAATSPDCRVYSTAPAPNVFLQDRGEVARAWLLEDAGTAVSASSGAGDTPAAAALSAMIQPEFWDNAFEATESIPLVTQPSPEPVQLLPPAGFRAVPPAPPAAAFVRAASVAELRSALRNGVTHIVVAAHLDLRPLGNKLEALPVPSTTQTIRGDCAGADYPEGAPPRRVASQCLLRLTSMALFLTGSHSERVWLSDLVLAMHVPRNGGAGYNLDYITYASDYDYLFSNPDYEAYFDLGGDGAGAGDPCEAYPSRAAPVEPPPPPGSPPLPVFDRALGINQAEMWLTRVDFHGGGIVKPTALNVFQSSLYARDCAFEDFAYELTDFDGCEEDLPASSSVVTLQNSNATFVGATFARNAMVLGEECRIGASVFTVQGSPELEGTPVLWLEDCSFVNNSVTYVAPAPPPSGAATGTAPAGGPASDGAAAAAAQLSPKPDVPISVQAALPTYSSSGGPPVLNLLTGEVEQPQPTAAAVAASLGVLSEEDPWFIAISRDQAEKTGLPNLRVPGPAARAEATTPITGDRGGGGGGDGADVGAILGGVLGGVALLALLAAGTCWWRRRALAQQRKEAFHTPAAILGTQRSISSTKPGEKAGAGPAWSGGVGGDGAPLTIFRYQVPKGSSSLGSAGSDGSTTRAYVSVVAPARNAAAGEAAAVRSGLGSNEAAPNTTVPMSAWANTFSLGGTTTSRSQVSGDVREALAATLDELRATGVRFYGDYVVKNIVDRREGGQGMVQFMARVRDGGDFVAKFFFDVTCFEREAAFYGVEAISEVLPDVEARVDNRDGAVRAPNGFVYPPFIIAERGESLDEWARRVAPDGVTAMFVLTHIAKRLQLLHAAGLSHRDLKPANILWRPSTNSWTLIDFGCAAWHGEKADLFFSLHYAAPEMLEAMERGDCAIIADAAVDVWALGVVAFELLTQTRAFPPGASRSDIAARIVGRAPLAWEEVAAEGEGGAEGGAGAAAGLLAKLGRLRRSVLSCLARRPEDRPTALEILNRWNSLLENATTA